MVRWAIPLLLVLVAPGVGAQAERRSPEQLAVADEQCLAASAAVARKAITEIEAIRFFAACADSGGSFLAARWRRPPEDSAILSALVLGSRRMHDARVSEAALAALQNRSNALAVRIAALQVIVAHIDPDVWIEYGPMGTTTFQPWPGHPQPKAEEHVQFGIGRPYAMLTRGSMPVTEATRQRLTQALQLLSRGPDDRYLLLAIGALPHIMEPGK